MKIILTADTNVRLPKGTKIDVSEAEAERLVAFGVAEKEAPKKKKK